MVVMTTMTTTAVVAIGTNTGLLSVNTVIVIIMACYDVVLRVLDVFLFCLKPPTW